MPASSRRNRSGIWVEDPRAVTRVRVGALGPTVLELLERVERPRDDLVRARRADARDEGDAARVVLVARVVQAVSLPAGLFTSSGIPRLLRGGALVVGEREIIER